MFITNSETSIFLEWEMLKIPLIFCQGDYNHPIISVEGILITMSFYSQGDFVLGDFHILPLGSSELFDVWIFNFLKIKYAVTGNSGYIKNMFSVPFFVISAFYCTCISI